MLPFDLHKAIIGLENHFLVFLREDVLHGLYCISQCMRFWYLSHQQTAQAEVSLHIPTEPLLLTYTRPLSPLDGFIGKLATSTKILCAGPYILMGHELRVCI